LFLALCRQDSFQHLTRRALDDAGLIGIPLGKSDREILRLLQGDVRRKWRHLGIGLDFERQVCLIALVIWELMRDDPVVDIRLLCRRQFGACFLCMLGTGAIVIATTQILPQLLQAELGYTAMLAGLVLSPGGIVTMIMMPVTGKLIGTVQPRYLIMTGAAIAALSMWHLTGLTGDISYGYAALSRIYLAIGLPLLFLPVTTASYEGVPPKKTNQASALISVARNLGGWASRWLKPSWRNASNFIKVA
jgi:MFS transporter, DHA2 family, multidrug resistance protein